MSTINPIYFRFEDDKGISAHYHVASRTLLQALLLTRGKETLVSFQHVAGQILKEETLLVRLGGDQVVESFTPDMLASKIRTFALQVADLLDGGADLSVRESAILHAKARSEYGGTFRALQQNHRDVTSSSAEAAWLGSHLARQTEQLAIVKKVELASKIRQAANGTNVIIDVGTALWSISTKKSTELGLEQLLENIWNN
jgi:hypothetical protein